MIPYPLRRHVSRTELLTAALLALSTPLLVGGVVGTLFAQSGGGSLPDLFVEGVTFNADRRPAITLRNAGTVTVATRPHIFIRVEWVDAAGSVIQTWNSAYVSPASIAAGDDFVASPPTNITTPASAHRFWVTLDPDNAIPESNERNNGWEVPVPGATGVQSSSSSSSSVRSVRSSQRAKSTTVPSKEKKVRKMKKR